MTTFLFLNSVVEVSERYVDLQRLLTEFTRAQRLYIERRTLASIELLRHATAGDVAVLRSVGNVGEGNAFGEGVTSLESRHVGGRLGGLGCVKWKEVRKCECSLKRRNNAMLETFG